MTRTKESAKEQRTFVEVSSVEALRDLSTEVKDAKMGERQFSRHINKNGSLGGFVESTARATEFTIIGQRALVLESALVRDAARIEGDVTVIGNVKVSECANLSGNMVIGGFAEVASDVNYNTFIFEDGAARIIPKCILVLDENPVVTAHLANQIKSRDGDRVMPISAEETQDFQKLSKERMFTLLRGQKFSVILMNGELGLGLGQKRGSDGQIILNRLRTGEYGKLNQKAPVFSIFGDYRLDGAAGIVSNNLALGVRQSGIADVLRLAGIGEKQI